MSNKHEPDNGNAYASQMAFQKSMYTIGADLSLFEGFVANYDDDDLVVSKLVIRLPEGHGSEYLIVGHATHLHEKLVCFHRDTTLAGALHGLVRRFQNKSMKWQPDKYE